MAQEAGTTQRGSAVEGDAAKMERADVAAEGVEDYAGVWAARLGASAVPILQEAPGQVLRFIHSVPCCLPQEACRAEEAVRCAAGATDV